MGELIAQVRALLASGAVVVSVGGGWFLVGPPDAPPATVRVAAFNIQVFGRAKSEKPEVMDVLARTAREFDVLVVQEIRDASMQTADDFLDLINSAPGADYQMFESERLGRTSAKEQYAIYYRSGVVDLVRADIVADPGDVFEREPIVATLRAGDFDFKLVAIHIKPDSALAELQALESVVDSLRLDDPDEQDVIVLGDLNADCDYLTEDAEGLPLRGLGYEWVIHDDLATSTRTDCTYDRIVLTEESFVGSYLAGSADVFRFDVEYGLTDHDFVISVSDHYPVYADFRLGSGG